MCAVLSPHRRVNIPLRRVNKYIYISTGVRCFVRSFARSLCLLYQKYIYVSIYLSGPPSGSVGWRPVFSPCSHYNFGLHMRQAVVLVAVLVGTQLPPPQTTPQCRVH